jgi:hypothetical protein
VKQFFEFGDITPETFLLETGLPAYQYEKEYQQWFQLKISIETLKTLRDIRDLLMQQ